MASVEKGACLRGILHLSALTCVHAAQTNTYYAYCGKKGHLTAQEAVVAINALGIPCTAQEVLSAGLSGP